MEQAASGTREVSSNIDEVNKSSAETGDAATQITSASSELSQQAELLKGEVSKFLDTVRAA